jgi:hypothetical protein
MELVLLSWFPFFREVALYVVAFFVPVLIFRLLVRAVRASARDVTNVSSRW